MPSTQSDEQRYVESVKLYVKCMRGKGLHLSDPDAKGNIEDSPPLRGTSPEVPVARKAYEVCSKLKLPEPDSIAYPPLTPDELKIQSKIAVCMRSHGVPEYPDPVADINPKLPQVAHRNSTIDRLAATAVFQTALDICSNLIYGTTGHGVG